MPRKETHSEQFAVGQKPALVMPQLDEDINKNREQVVLPVDKPLETELMKALAMDNDVMLIRIEPSSGENPPKYVPCTVQGKGAEIFENGKWVSYGFFPVGVEIITRRKYVGVLAMARREVIRTRVVERLNENPDNITDRVSSALCTFSILEDRNPKGREWLNRLISLAA